MAGEIQVFHGTFLHSATSTDIEVFHNGLMIVSAEGKISHLERDVTVSKLNERLSALGIDTKKADINTLKRGQFLIPGFIDTHNHAPQWAQRGTGLGLLLLEWLNNVTFKHEARFADAEYARRMYAKCVAGFLRMGVTTAAYYGSLHGEATKILADICVALGQRALVGKCNMVRHGAYFYHDASNEESLAVTEDFVAHCKEVDPEGELVRPIITPRFAICCDEELLEGLGNIAEREHAMIQTHFNETSQEVAFTKTLFPQFKCEADLYTHFKLFNDRTILGHCIHPSEYEIQRMKEANVGIAHCPISTSTGEEFGAAPIRRYLDEGMKVGLGTDNGGGFSSSILDSIRLAKIIAAGRATRLGDDKWRITLWEAFYMATLGGARVCNLGDKVGDFKVGKEFDALLIDVSEEVDSIVTVMEDDDTEEELLEKFLMTGDDRNIIKVWVRGHCVKAVKA